MTNLSNRIDDCLDRIDMLANQLSDACSYQFWPEFRKQLKAEKVALRKLEAELKSEQFVARVNLRRLNGLACRVQEVSK